MRGPFQHAQQIGCCGATFREPEVHDFFDQSGALAKIVQANHASTSLEGVEGTAHDGEGFLVGRVVLQFRQRARYQLQYFLRFHDEDFEQFRFDFAFHRHRRCGHYNRRWRSSGDRRGLLRNHLARRLRRYRHKQFGHGRRQRLVDDDRFRLERGCARWFFKRDFAQHALLAVEGEALFGRFKILREHVDKEAERADVLCDVLQRGRVQFRVAFRSCQCAHCFLDVQGGAHGVFLVEDGDGALQLVQHRIDLRERLALGGIGIVIVKHLFNLAQAVLHFSRQHCDRLVLLDLARQVALPLWRGRRGLAGRQRQQALADDDGVSFEVVRQLANLAQAMLDEQHRCCHFERELVLAPAHERGDRGALHFLHQRCQRRCAKPGAGGGDDVQLRFEFGFEAFVRVARQLVPGVGGAGERILGAAQRFRIDPAVTLLLVVGRYHAVDAVGTAQRLRRR